MKAHFALLAGLFTAAVTGLAIPSRNAGSEVAALEERNNRPEAQIITLEGNDLVSDSNAISSFLDTASSGTGFSSQSAWKKAAKAAHNALVNVHQLINSLAHYCDHDPSWQSGNSTSYGIAEDLEPQFAQLAELNYATDQTEIQSILNDILFGSSSSDNGYGYCNNYVPAVDDFLTAASNVLEELKHPDDALQGVSVNTPNSCGTSSKRSVFEA